MTRIKSLYNNVVGNYGFFDYVSEVYEHPQRVQTTVYSMDVLREENNSRSQGECSFKQTI